jgi:hypothetical protein
MNPCNEDKCRSCGAPKPRTYRMPDDSYTTSHEQYMEAWRKIGNVIADATNSRLFGFDPGLVFQRIGFRTTWGMDTDIALKFYEALTKSK